MGNQNEDEEYFRNLILDFRISQLNAILSFAGQNKSGRKEVLQEKALELVKSNNKTIILKIKEIANLSNRKRDNSTSSDTQGYSCSMESSYSNPYTSPIPDSPTPSSHQSSNNGDGNESPAQRSSLPTFPDVKLKSLPFFDILDVLLKPSSLKDSTNARIQEQQFVFHLTPNQCTQVTQSVQRRPNMKPEYRKQIQMRFSLLETSCEQEDHFPSSVSVKVNDRMCPLPSYASKPGSEPCRPPKPVNITALCKLSATSDNSVTISWAVESGKMFTVSFYLVEILDYQDLLQRLKDKGERQPDYTKALIKEKLKDRDSEISTTTCKVSLACPLGKMRMRNPCRPTGCDHLQTFDAESFLQMMEKKPKWTCPVCIKPARYEDLMIDGFFSQLIRSERLATDEHEIVLNEDGSWESLPQKEEQVQNIVSSQKEELVPIDDSDSDSNVKPEASIVAVKRPFAVDECITLDSDSEPEEPDNKKFRSTSPNQGPATPDSDIIILDDDI